MSRCGPGTSGPQKIVDRNTEVAEGALRHRGRMAAISAPGQ